MYKPVSARTRRSGSFKVIRTLAIITLSLQASLLSVACGGSNPEPVSEPSVDDAIDDIMGEPASSQGPTPSAPAAAPVEATPAANPRNPVTPNPPPPSSGEDWRPGSYLMQALTKLAGHADKVQEETSLGFAKGGTTIFGAYMVKGTPVPVQRQFQGGQVYVVIGATHPNGPDIDIVVRDASNKVLAKDTQDDSTPVVKFIPPSTGQYVISMHTQGSGFAAMALMEDGGYRIPMDRIQKSVYGNVQKAGKLHAEVRRKSGGRGLIFHEGGGWCVLGTVLSQGDEVSQWFTLPAAQYVFLGSGDQSSTNLDLRLRDERGQVLESDVEADATPLVGYKSRGGSYKLGLQAVATQSLTLATVVALKVE